MKKISLVLALIILASAVLTSCGGKSYKAYKVDPSYVSTRETNPNMTISGVDGVKVSVPKTVNKVVCFAPEAALIIRQIDLESKIVGADEASIDAVGSLTQVGLEAISKLSPDVVFIKESYDATPLATADIPYFTIPEQMTITDIKTLTKIIEKIFASSAGLEAEIENQQTIAQQTTALYAKGFPTFIDIGGLGRKKTQTTGTGTYINEIINIVGGENVFADKEGFIEVTKEDIIKANPSFIFTTKKATDYTDDDDFADVDAVKNGNVYQISAKQIEYATPEISNAIQTMFEKINTYKESTNK